MGSAQAHLRLVEDTMEKRCNISLVTEISTPSIIDAAVANAAAELKIKPSELCIIPFVDFSKLGALSQPQINKHCAFVAHAISKNRARFILRESNPCTVLQYVVFVFCLRYSRYITLVPIKVQDPLQYL